MNWQNEKNKVQEIARRLDNVDDAYRRAKSSAVSAAELLLRSQEAQEALQFLAQAVQQKAHERISQVVSSCLKAVFPDDPYEFQITFERKRGKTEAALTFRRGDLVVDPLSASGGGVVDVAAFALRIACLVLHRPRLSRMVCLDEPFKNVSAGYQDNVRLMLEQISKDMKIQIIQVTHNRALTLGKIIDLS
jgi:hypothetical protein